MGHDFRLKFFMDPNDQASVFFFLAGNHCLVGENPSPFKKGLWFAEACWTFGQGRSLNVFDLIDGMAIQTLRFLVIGLKPKICQERCWNSSKPAELVEIVSSFWDSPSWQASRRSLGKWANSGLFEVSEQPIFPTLRPWNNSIDVEIWQGVGGGIFQVCSLIFVSCVSCGCLSYGNNKKSPQQFFCLFW